MDKQHRHLLHRLASGAILAAAILLGLPAIGPDGAVAASPDPASLEMRMARDFEPLRRFAQSSGDQLWPGYGSAPFGVLLVLPSQEVLLCQNESPAGFVRSDAIAGCDRSVRPRSNLPDNLLAAMGVFGPQETIVVGTPEATSRTYPAWLRTLFHEHFHQWQASRPGYQEAMTALSLAGDDRSGMWMLNFPVPYDDPALGAAFARASLSLAAAVEAKDPGDFKARVRDYLDARKAFASAAGDRNWRYIEFQLWQEGVARWTEIRLGQAYSDPAIRAASDALDQETRAALRSPNLKGQRRVFVYAYGAAEAMLLDRCDPSWRGRYLRAPALGALLEDAVRTCGAA